MTSKRPPRGRARPSDQSPAVTRAASKSWTLYHHRRLGIIELSFRGGVTANEMFEGSAARVELGAKESISDFLLDGSECTTGRATAQTV